jgi:5'-3' exonuclease
MQFPLAERAVGALGIVYWPVREYEADDVIGSAAVKYSRNLEVDQVIICSPDKDLSQVVCEKKIVCLDRRKGVVLDEKGVLEKFGILPKSIPDYLGLMGDNSDGIPGIPRWGAKASSTLLERYESIEAIPTDYRLWDVNVRGAAGLSNSLEEHREVAALYKDLATLRLNAPVSEKVDDLEWPGAHSGLYPKLCEELGMPNLANQPHRWSS